jgi:hypothetical protein
LHIALPAAVSVAADPVLRAVASAEAQFLRADLKSIVADPMGTPVNPA